MFCLAAARFHEIIKRVINLLPIETNIKEVQFPFPYIITSIIGFIDYVRNTRIYKTRFDSSHRCTMLYSFINKIIFLKNLKVLLKYNIVFFIVASFSSA